jgi:hypothetical protein
MHIYILCKTLRFIGILQEEKEEEEEEEEKQEKKCGEDLQRR